MKNKSEKIGMCVIMCDTIMTKPLILKKQTIKSYVSKPISK